MAQQAAAKAAHGKRIADVLGCTGCHGKDLQGERFHELYASNLTRDVANYTDQQLEHVLRVGVPPTGRELWGMPSELFQHLSAPDMAALIAHLRTLPAGGKPTQQPLPFPPEVQQMIAKGEIKPTAATVREAKALGPVHLGSTYELGRYISRVTCAECHGPELKGGRETPDLVVAGAYSRDEFEQLMVEGTGTGGRKLKPMMEGVSKGRFSKMTAGERNALYAYLKARAQQPQ
ncbi:MAG: c-type cytochrome [Sphingomonas sp.]|nr:c-type cytochrome [Sphingomonas sp.]